MKTFLGYLSLKEMEGGVEVGGDLDSNSSKSYSAAMQAFEIIMSSGHSKPAINFLNQMSEIVPEIKPVLQQYGLDSFKDGDFKGSGKKGKIISKGLADVSAQDANSHDDVVATNSADSYHNPLG